MNGPLINETLNVKDLFHEYYVDYASYVILERAIPNLYDGLKPVQRRILHSLFEKDDGRYSKVANIVGHCMQYHPHGDMSIKDAMVNIGQKNILIDTQGNWGNILTGDSAAAGRYIEARLTQFAKEVVFNKKLTNWNASYDGRNQEPALLPVKVPLLLAQGAEGIAVGLSTRILPHNMRELLSACIAHLRNEEFRILPDFPTGGVADYSDYTDGLKGGKVKIRAVIEKASKNSLVIRELPFGVTTSSLIDSIVSANEKGKIKIKKVEDNTSKKVEIIVHAESGTDLELLRESLFSFSRCEESISTNACIIHNNKPVFLTVTEMLKFSAEHTKLLTKKELEIKALELKERIFRSSLEKIFIEEKIYRTIEDCDTWKSVENMILKKMQDKIRGFHRKMNSDDIISLTEMQIKKITKFDKKKADELLIKLSKELTETERNIKNINTYTIKFFESLIFKYYKDESRKTQISKGWKKISKAKVAVANLKLFANKKDGFIGTGNALKKEEYIQDCSNIDEVICFFNDGTFKVVKINDKVFVGKGLLDVRVYHRGDTNTVYTLVYADGPDGKTMGKRFIVPAITRDKTYDLTKGTPGSKLLHFEVGDANDAPSNIKVTHKPKKRIKKEVFYYLGDLSVKGRTSQGNIISRYPASNVARSELQVQRT